MMKVLLVWDADAWGGGSDSLLHHMLLVIEKRASQLRCMSDRHIRFSKRMDRSTGGALHWATWSEQPKSAINYRI